MRPAGRSLARSRAQGLPRNRCARSFRAALQPAREGRRARHVQRPSQAGGEGGIRAGRTPLGRRDDPVPGQGEARDRHRAQAGPRAVEAEASGEVRPVVRPDHRGRGGILRRPSGLRAGEGGQAWPEETSRRGKFSSATEEEEEADAAVLARPVRAVHEQRSRAESSDDNGEGEHLRMFPDAGGRGRSSDAGSVAITSRKQGLNVLEVFAGTPENFIEALRFE